MFTPDDRKAIEDRLRERVQATWQEYKEASDRYKIASTELDARMAPPADGTFRLAQAAKQQNRALRDYIEALQRFDALILDGKFPESDGSPNGSE
jgi:hypothetical protein